MSKVKWLFGKLAIIKSQNFKHAISSKIDLNNARKLAFAPHINIGVFSLEKKSKGWSIWQKNLSNLETEFLPLNCNWIASNLLPKFDEEAKTFVEPYLPNYKIGIMHLAAGIWQNNQDMRLDKNITIDIKTLKNTKISKSLRFIN